MKIDQVDRRSRRESVVSVQTEKGAVIFGVDSMRISRAGTAVADRASYYADLGHDVPLTGADEAWLAKLFAAVEADDHVRLPHGEDVEISRLNIGNTYACNMGCSYCYNELDIKDVKGSQVRGGMSEATSIDAVDALFEQSTEGRPLSLVFIGGEALLERKTLEKTVAHARERARTGGHPLSIAVYTNGTLMTPKVIEWADANDVSLVISLDGPPQINDAYRVFKSGRPTSGHVLKNIRKLMEMSPDSLKRIRSVAVRPVDLLALHKYFYDMGFNEIHVQPLYDEKGIGEAGADDSMRELLDWYVEKLRAGIILSVLPFETFFEKFLTQGRAVASWYPCTAGVSSLGVGPGGTIYPCHHFLEEKDYEVGHVSLGLPTFRERTDLFQNVNERQPCASCWAKHACGGECYHRAHTAGHGYTGVLEDTCRSRKSHIGLALEAFAQLASEAPDALRALAAKQYTSVPSNAAAFEAENLDPYRV